MSKVCNFCGNVLNDDDKFCTKCGAVAGQTTVNQTNTNVNTNTTQTTYYYNNASNGTAVAAMILGILSLVVFWIPFIPFVFGVLGLVFGIKGLNAADLNQGKGRGMGIAGIVCGSIGMIVGIFYSIFWIAIFYVAFEEYDYSKNTYNKYKNYSIDIYSQVQTIDEEKVDTILDNYKF